VREPVVILAAGPSLTMSDVDYVRDTAAYVIAVNDLWRWAPWCDHLHACDVSWWAANPVALGIGATKTVVEPMDTPQLEQLDALRREGVEVLRETGRIGYDPALGCVRTGQNSGYQALHWALQQGARKVILLGLDMCLGEDGSRRCHSYGKSGVGGYAKYAKNFDSLVAPAQTLGAEVVNCTARSTVEAFSKRELRDVL